MQKTLLDTNVKAVREWFRERGILNAIVGYSGGIDSTVTALLLAAAGIHVILVVAEAPNQRYSSPWGGLVGANKLATMGNITVRHQMFQYPFSDKGVIAAAANEAALPILRVAVFYGIAAELREIGWTSVVVGTANLSEAAFLGFWGKASDGAQDFYPISHLSKSQVYQLGSQLNAPSEIMNATPSGDLLFEQTDDFRMIGATYDEIQTVIDFAEAGLYYKVLSAIEAVYDPKKFADNIIRNSFKYELPFPGLHLFDRLEKFRIKPYLLILEAAHNA